MPKNRLRNSSDGQLAANLFMQVGGCELGMSLIHILAVAYRVRASRSTRGEQPFFPHMIKN